MSDIIEKLEKIANQKCTCSKNILKDHCLSCQAGGILNNIYEIARYEYNVLIKEKKNIKSKIEVGDKVRTTKGCRIKGTHGNLIVVEIGRKWKAYNAVLCRKVDGKIKLFLEKNLVKVGE